MKSYGHIKISRKTFDLTHGDDWWFEPRVFSRWEAWVYVIQLAQWQARVYQTRYGAIRLERGEFVASIRELAKTFQWGERRVRTWLKHTAEPETSDTRGAERSHTTLQKTTRLQTQRKTQAGTVYLIVKYDTYQGVSATSDLPGDTPNTTAFIANRLGLPYKPTQEQEVKANKALTVIPASGPSFCDIAPKFTARSFSEAKYPAFPIDLCQRLYERWVKHRGAVQFSTFRKALSPLFPTAGALYTEQQLADAIVVSAEYVIEMEDREARFESIHTFAQRIHAWVQLGMMPLAIDGVLTIRGLNAGSKLVRHARRVS